MSSEPSRFFQATVISGVLMCSETSVELSFSLEINAGYRSMVDPYLRIKSHIFRATYAGGGGH